MSNDKKMTIMAMIHGTVVGLTLYFAGLRGWTWLIALIVIDFVSDLYAINARNMEK